MNDILKNYINEKINFIANEIQGFKEIEKKVSNTKKIYTSIDMDIYCYQKQKELLENILKKIQEKEGELNEL